MNLTPVLRWSSILAWLTALPLALSAAESIPLQTLDLTLVQQGWGHAQTNRSIREKPLAIAGKTYAEGVGTHAKSTLWIQLDGGTERFRAQVGVDDACGGAGSVEFKVLGDGKTLWQSGTMKPGQAAKAVDLDLRGVKLLLLSVGDAGDGVSYDHANWAEARFEVSGPRPRAVTKPQEKPYLLTPKPGPAPRLNGPLVYGCRPGHPFLYRIPATGTRPMEFSARNLPDTLKLDPATGIITGIAPARGDYLVNLTAKNPAGQASRSLTIKSGDTLSLTPPMGWNHWYAHYNRVTDKMMREAADTLINSGLADVGYEYVNIDDCWMNAPPQAKREPDALRVGPLRDDQGNMVPNRHFPDMKALTAYIHGRGLKAGLYTSPGPLTCGGFAGSYQHEAQDARLYAEWGFDFLKYDWCSYGKIAGADPSLAALKKPYQQMGDLLKEQPRDMVFNLCQYGMGDVWKWGESVGGHCWRTAGDLGFELDRIFEVALKNSEYRAYSRPGAWNDPDYLQIGWIGNARNGGLPQPCSLSPNEQYAFMSLWCLMASPLFYSGDLSKVDDFTLNVLGNPEVIEVDQDPLGQSAAVTRLNEQVFIMVKDLADGTKAVGLFNQGEFDEPASLNWALAGVGGPQMVRDLWRQTNLGVQAGEFKTTVPPRGVVMVRLMPARPSSPTQP
jgi:alpha-galactosidase